MLRNLRVLGGLLLLLLLLLVIVLAGGQAVKLFSLAAPVPANITVDAANLQGELPRPWLGLAQGGEQEEPGKLVSLAPVASQIRSLGARYVRIDHVLDHPHDALLVQRIREIQAVGALPLISLSYFPPDAATTDVGTVTNWAVWQARVKTLVETVSGKGNLNIQNVYYEVWNEPDGPGFGAFNIGSGKDYFPLYQRTVAAASSAQNVNPFRIGGPALADLRRCTNGLLFICQTYWLDTFLDLVQANQTRLDFISWHKYATKISDFNEDVNFLQGLSAKHPNLPPSERLITEWGSYPEKNGAHAGVFDAAHLVAASRAFLGFVDLATKFEIRDGPEPGEKGWGILYHDGAPKPAFAAIGLLNRLRFNRVLVTGEGTFVSAIGSQDGSGATVLVANYDRSASHAEAVPVNILNLPTGNYRLTKIRLNGQRPLGSPEITTISSASAYTTTEAMLPNSLLLIDLQHQP